MASAGIVAPQVWSGGVSAAALIAAAGTDVMDHPAAAPVVPAGPFDCEAGAAAAASRCGFRCSYDAVEVTNALDRIEAAVTGELAALRQQQRDNSAALAAIETSVDYLCDESDYANLRTDGADGRVVARLALRGLASLVLLALGLWVLAPAVSGVAGLAVLALCGVALIQAETPRVRVLWRTLRHAAEELAARVRGWRSALTDRTGVDTAGRPPQVDQPAGVDESAAGGVR